LCCQIPDSEFTGAEKEKSQPTVPSRSWAASIIAFGGPLFMQSELSQDSSSGLICPLLDAPLLRLLQRLAPILQVVRAYDKLMDYVTSQIIQHAIADTNSHDEAGQNKLRLRSFSWCVYFANIGRFAYVLQSREQIASRLCE
jgi:hypothetical protein